jgi:hypothetical protein
MADTEGTFQVHAGILIHINLELLKLRDIGRHRVLQAQAALFQQHHDRHAGDRLGHGEDAVEGINLRGTLLFDVHVAEGLEIGQFSAPPHEQQQARHIGGLHVALRHRVQSIQTRRR